MSGNLLQLSVPCYYMLQQPTHIIEVDSQCMFINELLDIHRTPV